MKIEIVEYNPHRANQFMELSKRLYELLSFLDPIIEHIGSTSVVGLASKNVIDIAVGVKEYNDLDRCILPMTENAFIYYELFNQSMPERRLFVALKENRVLSKHGKIYSKNSDIDQEAMNKLRIANIHVWIHDSSEWQRHIAFRDYLREHKDIRDEYAKIKKKLSAKNYIDTMEYNDGKNDFIKRTEKKALEWYQKRNDQK